MKDPKKYKLTDSVTTGQLKFWISDKNEKSKLSIIELIRHRFKNRYLKHIQPPFDSGFLIMAVCCLNIEALESFREGKANTKGNSRTMFKIFLIIMKNIFLGSMK